MEIDISGNIAVPAAPPEHLAVFEQDFLVKAPRKKSLERSRLDFWLLTPVARYE
jgi:hypothetical protein